MSNHVFVSHSHDDAPAADLIVKALEGRGVACWVAPRDVPAGGSYAESILNAIESASCFVLIYSQSSNVSSHVMREVERALKFGVNIVPVRFDDSTPSKSLDYLLATVHWLAIAPDARERSIATAAEQILAAVTRAQSNRPAGETEKVAPTRTVPAPVAAPPKRNLVWIGAAAVFILVAGLIAFFVLRNPAPVQNAQKGGIGSRATGPSSATATTKIDGPGQPLGVTHRYFELLGNRNVAAASNLLSANMRRHLSMTVYSTNVARLPRAKLVEATIVSQGEGNASVKAVLEEESLDTHEQPWQAPIDLVLESGAWRIDNMKGIIPASGHPLPDSAKETGGEATQDVSESAPQSGAAPPSTLPSSPAQQQKMYVIVQNPEGTAKVREGPLGHSRMVTELKNGERVEIDRFEGGWAHIIIGPNQSGFILKAHLNMTPEKP
jgi:hypothetical protein